MLRAVAGAIAGAVREDDVPARYGGEEFAVLLRNPTLEVAVDVGERVRQAVADLDLSRLGVPAVSVSVGAAVASDPDEPIDSVIEQADRRPLSREAPRAATRSSPLSPPARPPSAGRRYHRPGARSRPPNRDDLADARRRRITTTSRRADVLADEAADLTNGDLARVFHEIGDILEVQGEVAFKTIAYHRAADAIGRSPVDLVAAYRAGNPPKVPGVGQAISDKIAEFVTTGRMAYLERLRAEVPASLVELLQIPGLGPKTVRQLHERARDPDASATSRPPRGRAASGRSAACPSGPSR